MPDKGYSSSAPRRTRTTCQVQHSALEANASVSAAAQSGQLSGAGPTLPTAPKKRPTHHPKQRGQWSIAGQIFRIGAAIFENVTTSVTPKTTSAQRTRSVMCFRPYAVAQGPRLQPLPHRRSRLTRQAESLLMRQDYPLPQVRSTALPLEPCDARLARGAHEDPRARSRRSCRDRVGLEACSGCIGGRSGCIEGRRGGRAADVAGALVAGDRRCTHDLAVAFQVLSSVHSIRIETLPPATAAPPRLTHKLCATPRKTGGLQLFSPKIQSMT